MCIVTASCPNAVSDCAECKTDVTVDMVNGRVTGVTVSNLMCYVCASNFRASADGTACLSSTGGMEIIF